VHPPRRFDFFFSRHDPIALIFPARRFGARWPAAGVSSTIASLHVASAANSVQHASRASRGQSRVTIRYSSSSVIALR
jgi:hypothetical protein